MLPLYAKLLGVHDRGFESAWRDERDFDRAVENHAVPSFRCKGIRSRAGKGAVEELK